MAETITDSMVGYTAKNDVKKRSIRSKWPSNFADHVDRRGLTLATPQEERRTRGFPALATFPQTDYSFGSLES
jgi:hypothetical protein